MADQENVESLTQTIGELKDQIAAMRAGVCTAIGALSIGLREVPGYNPALMDAFITHALKHSWPLQDVPDNEVNEEQFSAPLRFLLQQHEEARKFLRDEINRRK
ncbi:hypothetical protein [Pseudomonas sp. 1121_17]|uniref:hypothetical protein n=1 Tax=Pseudomonas sp. 1121_17 TaxID=2604458 RepID=UPI004063C6D0